MPALRHLTCSVTLTDRTRPILDKTVSPKSVVLELSTNEPQAIFRASQVEGTLDIAEISLGTHILQEAHQKAAYAALPVFLSRSFRHNAIFVRADRGVRTAADLNGKRIGIQGLQQTATIWLRGILAEHYGLKSDTVEWVIGGLNSPENLERTPLQRQPNLRCTACPADQTLSQQLADGAIDAILAPNPPACMADPDVPVRRLFSDPAAEEREYFRRSGIFPIMHVLGVRKTLLNEMPDLGAELFRAFCRAKAMAQADTMRQNYLRISLPWIVDAARETRALMGGNPWSYGFRRNREGIEALVRYARNDGLVEDGLDAAALFWLGSLDWVDPEDDAQG
jgi:4,5-dihydroxyphthalate decarboxylase